MWVATCHLIHCCIGLQRPAILICCDELPYDWCDILATVNQCLQLTGSLHKPWRCERTQRKFNTGWHLNTAFRRILENVHVYCTANLPTPPVTFFRTTVHIPGIPLYLTTTDRPKLFAIQEILKLTASAASFYRRLLYVT